MESRNYFDHVQRGHSERKIKEIRNHGPGQTALLLQKLALTMIRICTEGHFFKATEITIYILDRGKSF